MTSHPGSALEGWCWAEAGSDSHGERGWVKGREPRRAVLEGKLDPPKGKGKDGKKQQR